MQKQSQKPARNTRNAKAAETKAATETKAAETKSAKAKADKAADKAKAAEQFAADVKAARQAAATLINAADSGTISIPVKSFAAFKRSYKRDVTAHPAGRKPSKRQAAALAVACLASGKSIADGATFQRRFTVADKPELALENGCLSDCIASGLATYNGAADTITLAPKAAAEIASQLGAFKLPTV